MNKHQRTREPQSKYCTLIIRTCKLLRIYVSLVGVFLLTVGAAHERAWGQTDDAIPEIASPIQKRYEISGIDFRGIKRLDSDSLRNKITISPGSISASQVADAVKSLYRTGYFSQVSAVLSENRRLVFLVREKDVVRKSFIQGNEEIDTDDLAEAIDFGDQRYLHIPRIHELVAAGEELYQKKGYYDAKISYITKPVKEGEVDVVFNVKEGPKYFIRRIQTEGLVEVEEDDLLESIETRPYRWWKSWLLGSGKLNPELLETDRERLKQYFFDHGYVEAVVGEPRVKKKKGDITIIFPITEGKQYKVGAITFSGETSFSENELKEDLDSEVGSVFSATKVRSDAFKVSDTFGDKGYAFANVNPRTALGRDSKGKGVVNLEFEIVKGKLVKIDKIIIQGNEKTYDNVIRRTLVLHEQELYSSTKVRRSEELLKRLGFFEEATVSTERGTKEDEVNLQVNVKEGQTGSFSAGAGYSTTDQIIFNARLSEQNFLGTGRNLSLNFDVGARRNNLVLSLSDPRINDTFVSGSVNLLRTQRLFTDFTRETTGGSVSLGYPLEQVFGESFQDISASLQYELLSIDISDVDPSQAAQLVVDSAGKSTSSTISPRLLRNTIDNPLNPSNGSRQTVGLDYAGIGGDQEFVLFSANNTLYQPIYKMESGSLIFSTRNRLSYGESLNDDKFPLFQRFFPGGIDSVRGFQNRTLGPIDANGREFGGSKEFVTNFELIFPLVSSAGLRGVVFYDVGQAFDDDEQINLGELRKAYGFGLRWFSPLGPIRIEFGIPVARKEGEDSMVTQFSFGAPL
jgi:outer membrane protein insertion porin family